VHRTAPKPGDIPKLSPLDGAYLGFELWQVKAGSVFDNVLVTDSLADAESAWRSQYLPADRQREEELVGQQSRREEEEHIATTKRIEEMRVKQDIQMRNSAQKGSKDPSVDATDRPVTMVL
jgi:calreticulin